MKRKLEKLSCKYGAQMGRIDRIPSDINTVGRLHLEKLRWVDGDYDEGGCYWGCGGRGQNIYWAYGETQTGQVDIFVRAVGRVNAKEEVRARIKEIMPMDVTFYR